MKKQGLQIVHESEAQRQHVRIEIPAHAEIDGKVYKVENLSSGGLKIKGIIGRFREGEKVDLALYLAFKNFSLKVDLKAKIEHFSNLNQTMGCRFIELAPSQISILNYVLKSYMSGAVIVEGDILNIVSRDNFTRARKEETHKLQQNDLLSLFKRALPMLIIALIGLISVSFILGNVFEQLSIVKSYRGIVKSEVIKVRANSEGLFRSLVDENTDRVSLGQPLAEIHGEVMAPSMDGKANFVKRVETVRSPCDCFVVYQHVRTGEFRSLGEPIFKLIPTSTEPWVEMTVHPEQAQRIETKDEVNLRIGGDVRTLKGKVIDLSLSDEDVPQAIVKVRPERVLPANLIGRPVYAEFLVY